MKRAFTLVELMVVMAVLVTLMAIMFRISGIGADADNRTRTIVRLQRLENCLSGYYAAFGSYPPVKLHGMRDIYLRVGEHEIQSDERNEGIWGWDPDAFVAGKYQEAERTAWRQVEAACKSQPVACNFPFPSGYHDAIVALSEQMAELASEGQDEEYEAYWSDSGTRQKLMAKFDDGGSDSGGTGRFSDRKDETDWRQLQLFRFGLMSFLLPRYLFMMDGNRDFFTSGFKQWENNNELPSDPFDGNRYSGWERLKQIKESADRGNRQDLARLANIPSQAVCARWIPNLEGVCTCNRSPLTLFGVNVNNADGSSLKLKKDHVPEIYTPDGPDSGSFKDQYILDGVTVQDGWWHSFYYYSPEPHQTYVLWSAGPNGRTFPPWISRSKLSSTANRCVAVWTADDIIHMSN